MANYRRPNLTPTEYVIVLEMIKEQLSEHTVGSAEFEAIYKLYMKVRDTKLITA